MKSSAQPALGVVWEVPSDTTESLEQLNAFSALGVRYLEIKHPVSPQILSQLQRFDLSIFVRSSNEFLSISELREQREKLLDNYTSSLINYRAYPNVQAFGLFSYSHTGHPDFEQVIQPLLSTLNSDNDTHLYYYTTNAWYTFDDPDKSIGFYFDQEIYQPRDITDLYHRFQDLRNLGSDQILFMPSNWFMTAIQSYNPFTESLAIYQETGAWTIPLPEMTKDSVSANWIVFLLLFLWIVLAFQVTYLPYIRPMMIRYFFSHSFFVDDILHYRERATIGGFLIMIVHAVFGGLACYMSTRILISEAGTDAFFHHLPALAVTGSNHISFFFIAVILILLSQLVAIFWIYLPAKNLEHISQAINLYAGAFYFDYLLVTLMVTLFVSGIGTSFMLFLGVFFVVIWFMSFNIASINASRSMGLRKVTYLILTVGLHTLVTLLLILAVITNDSFLQILDLSLSLP